MISACRVRTRVKPGVGAADSRRGRAASYTYRCGDCAQQTCISRQWVLVTRQTTDVTIRGLGGVGIGLWAILKPQKPLNNIAFAAFVCVVCECEVSDVRAAGGARGGAIWREP